MKKRLFTKAGERTKGEKILITILISAIVLLTLAFGYDIYNSLKTKEEISLLNGAIVLLDEEKSQLILERDDLNQTLNTLTQQKSQLNTENSELALELNELQGDYDSLQTDYNTLSDELQDVKDDLETCEATP